MEVLGFTEARARLGELMAAVVADHNPVAIAQRKGGAVVLVSLTDWRAMEDALHPVSTPRDAAGPG